MRGKWEAPRPSTAGFETSTFRPQREMSRENKTVRQSKGILARGWMRGSPVVRMVFFNIDEGYPTAGWEMILPKLGRETSGRRASRSEVSEHRDHDKMQLLNISVTWNTDSFFSGAERLVFSKAAMSAGIRAEATLTCS